MDNMSKERFTAAKVVTVEAKGGTPGEKEVTSQSLNETATAVARRGAWPPTAQRERIPAKLSRLKNEVVPMRPRAYRSAIREGKEFAAWRRSSLRGYMESVKKVGVNGALKGGRRGRKLNVGSGYSSHGRHSVDCAHYSEWQTRLDNACSRKMAGPPSAPRSS